MMESNRALSELPVLLEERRRYEGWLAALEARRETTPAHVFERVQSDYRNRLQQVADKLAAHRGALSEERASIESRISLLEAETQMRRDERAELDLRLQVGELTAAEAAEALRALDSTLTELDGEKASLRGKVDAVRELLGERADAVPPHAPVAEAPPRPAPTAPEPAREFAPIPEAHAPPSQPSFDELAFLSSVIGSEQPAAQEARRTPPRSVVQEKLAEAEAAAVSNAHAVPPAPPAPPVVPPPPVRRPSEQRREPPIESIGHAESPMSGVRGSGTGVIREPAASEALLSALGARKEQPTDVAPLAANVPGNTPIVLRASGAVEHSKTLKCNECGAMNYATEWYCERCGAELAAL